MEGHPEGRQQKGKKSIHLESSVPYCGNEQKAETHAQVELVWNREASKGDENGVRLLQWPRLVD